ncbi:hypothetical protein [Paraflavitalea speifideaquila]|uniref:hypothetical protein n=1 Tax=Paraflavitalea speifideaquila TaxID=3076558 RepID=UPI0028EDE0DF|nr:hypothetical protein [Paraflavitalea speifideiaquila]
MYLPTPGNHWKIHHRSKRLKGNLASGSVLQAPALAEIMLNGKFKTTKGANSAIQVQYVE